MGSAILRQLLSGVPVFLGLLAFLAVPFEGAFRYGRRRAGDFAPERRSFMQVLQGTFTTLVALLLAFGVSMADNRYDSRRDKLAEEGIAFGTLRLRVALLPEATRKPFLKQLARNLEARIEFYVAIEGEQAEQALQRRIDEAQTAMWSLAADAQNRNAASTGLPLLVQSLNEAFDAQERQTRAFRGHLPGSILTLLLVSSAFLLASNGFVGGLERRRDPVYSFVLVLLVASTLFVILDLDRPRAGLIRTRPDNLIALLKGLE